MLPYHEEIQFINRLFALNAVRKGDRYNFSCPICREGGSWPRKKRGWFLRPQSGQNYVFHCYNECGTRSFKNFLEEYDPSLYDEYTAKERTIWLDDLKESNGVRTKQTLSFNKPKPKVDSLIELPTEFKELPKHAIDYLTSRKIPIMKYQNIRYIDSYTYRHEGRNVTVRDSIVFPYFHEDRDYIYGWQARGIEEKIFHTFVVEGNTKVYNYFSVDSTKPIFAFESIIDSFFVDNSIAMLGKDLPDGLFEDVIYVFDNDSTGWRQAEKYLENGKKVFIYPDSFNFKDLNTGIMNNSTIDEEFEEILNSPYQFYKNLIKIKLKRSNATI